MYEPPHFRIEDRDAVFSIIRAHPFGLLISQGEDGILANPVPFLLEQDDAGLPVLRAHLARPNPQWRALAAHPEALVVFQGLDHYVTPGWYATKRESGKVVPTWNYVHVQVRGRVSLREDAAFLGRQIEALTRRHESGRADAWAVSDAPEAYIAAQMRGIVGLEIAITSWSGKAKLSQNRSMADQAGVMAGLAAEPDAAGPQMAALMGAQQEKTQP